MAVLNAHANVVNGIYSVLEVILTLVLIRMLRILLGCHNLHTLYDARKPLHLKPTRLSVLVDIGLASHGYSICAALLGAAFIILCTAGGFAFSGTSVPVYESIQVRNKVVAATAGSYVNYREHVSPDASQVSATVLLLAEPGCSEPGVSKTIVYGRTNELHDLESIQWPRGEKFSNYTCLWEPEFKSEVLVTRRTRRKRISFEECDLGFKTVGVDFRKVEGKKLTQIPFSGDVSLGNCSFRITELWCSNYRTLRCAGSVRMNDEADGYGEILYFVRPDNGDLSLAMSALRLEKAHDTELLQTMAFVSDVVLRGSQFLTPILRLAMFRVETNGTAQRFIGTRSVTEVNVTLITATFGSAMGVLVMTTTAAAVAWVWVVLLRGRRGYNAFCSNADAVACAAQQLSRAGAESNDVVRGVAGNTFCVRRVGRSRA
eukprot:gb/GEZJ01005166.1/.p1 GENE.gb/GEZJ01005166.1/~~gb/GEZJ01005166.1/.p1  ORF type:complete len:431 (+),score=21.72 gb/GEZJ01005166.1/:265-1557(+)